MTTRKSFYNARLRFPQKLCLARALCDSKFKAKWFWDRLEDLNRFGNEFAHKFEIDEAFLGIRLKEFCLKVSKDSGTVITEDDALKIGGFYCAMVLLHKQYLKFHER